MTSSFGYHLLLVTASWTIFLLSLLVFFNRRVDILIFNGQVAGVIRTMNQALRVRGNTEFFLATSAPGADRAIFFIVTHKQLPKFIWRKYYKDIGVVSRSFWKISLTFFIVFSILLPVKIPFKDANNEKNNLIGIYSDFIFRFSFR